jgi:hypothetical protein
VPNLQPDTSIYANVGKPQGQMSPLDLMALITRMKEYQSQQNETQALTNAPQTEGPLGPTTDYSAVRRSMLQNPTGGFVSSDQMRGLEHLQQAQLASQQQKTDFILRTITPLLDLPPNKIAKAFAGIAPALVAANMDPVAVGKHFLGLDPEIVKRNIEQAKNGLDQQAARTNLALYKNMQVGPTGQEAMTSVPGPGGEPISQPSSAVQLQARGVRNAAFPGVQTGLPLGAKESGDQMAEDLRQAGTYSQGIFPLQQALKLAKDLGPGGMGPGTKGRQSFEEFVYSVMPSLVPADMQKKIKTYAELEKYLVNNTQQLAQTIGPHTNDGLASAVTGSPGVHINDLAGVDLIKANIAARKMVHTLTMQASRAGGPNYSKQKAFLAPQQDPRAFHIENAEPDEIDNWHKSLKGAEREKFNASLRAGIASGVISPSLKPGAVPPPLWTPASAAVGQ